MSETKLIRTSQMSVHGYPAGMSVFDCNLKLGLLRSRRDSWQCGTSHAEEDDVSCWCAARFSWSRSMLFVCRF